MTPSHQPQSEAKIEEKARRWTLLLRVEDLLETPMVILGFVWLVLLVIELTRGLSRGLEITGTIIWIIFLADFAIKLFLAPKKLLYMRANWLTVIALAVPALRVFRIFRAFRVLRLSRTVRGVSLVRIVTTLNRGMRALGRAMGRRGFGYVLVLTVIIVFAGAAGILAFEKNSVNGPSDYATALWWTAMLVTTMGSEFWPQTSESRVLCLLLAIYAFAIFGYIAATLASLFIEHDRGVTEQENPRSADVDKILAEINLLSARIDNLLRPPDSRP